LVLVALALVTSPAASAPAPDVLAAGKVTVVHFFASWCVPCAKSMPELDALYKRHGGAAAVFAFGEDDEEPAMRAFVARLGITYTVRWDGTKAQAGRWHVNTMPSTYVVDKHGAVRFTHGGYTTGDGATIETEVASLIAEP
jgi:cytochrome c biogenesis protein CcmG/thiol:disulfide interchange protein DsbE